jgi:hypothetical protein
MTTESQLAQNQAMTDGPGMPLLAAAREALCRHQQAILAQDPTAVAAANERLSRLLVDVTELSGSRSHPPDPSPAATGELASFARELREVVSLNLTLAQNGLAIVHHFALALAASAQTHASPGYPAGGSSSDDPALFAGVA